MKNYIFVWMAVLSIHSSYAFVDEDLNFMALKQSEVLESMAEVPGLDVFTLHNIAVLTRLEVAIEVPWIAKLNLRPEIELQWSR